MENKTYMEPEDVIKKIKELKGYSFFLRVDMPLYTNNNRAYRYTNIVKVSRKSIIKALEDPIDFNKRKAQKGQITGKIKVTDHPSKYTNGGCLFIG